jgi:hypothetical protein
MVVRSPFPGDDGRQWHVCSVVDHNSWNQGWKLSLRGRVSNRLRWKKCSRTSVLHQSLLIRLRPLIKERNGAGRCRYLTLGQTVQERLSLLGTLPPGHAVQLVLPEFDMVPYTLSTAPSDEAISPTGGQSTQTSWKSYDPAGQTMANAVEINVSMDRRDRLSRMFVKTVKTGWKSNTDTRGRGKQVVYICLLSRNYCTGLYTELVE